MAKLSTGIVYDDFIKDYDFCPKCDHDLHKKEKPTFDMVTKYFGITPLTSFFLGVIVACAMLISVISEILMKIILLTTALGILARVFYTQVMVVKKSNKIQK